MLPLLQPILGYCTCQPIESIHYCDTISVRVCESVGVGVWVCGCVGVWVCVWVGVGVGVPSTASKIH